MEKIPITEAILYRLEQMFWKLVGAEWSENWKAWPHCNGQAGCWTHTESRWCACICRWCRIARVARPSLHRTSEQHREYNAQERAREQPEEA